MICDSEHWKTARIIPAGIARDMAVILENSDIDPDPAAANKIETAWCRLKQTFAERDWLDDQLAVIMYFAKAESDGAVVIGQSSHKWVYLNAKPLIGDIDDRSAYGIKHRQLAWLLSSRLIQAIDVAKPDEFPRLPRPPLGVDQVKYRLTPEGHNAARLHLESIELRRHLSSKYDTGSPEYEAAVLEARCKEVFRHKELMTNLTHPAANRPSRNL